MSEKINEMITNQIIKHLESGVVPWHLPWTNGEAYNFISGATYRGINPFILANTGYSRPEWLTYKQAKTKGGNVKKGEKGTTIIFWKMVKTKEEDENGDKIQKPVLRYFTVFNVEQCEGLELPELKKREFTIIESAEKIIDEMENRPEIKHGRPKAFYNPRKDLINMPEQDLFLSDPEYYAVLFHELGHSTGHKSRLDRFSKGNNHMFGSKDYSAEELTAEMTAAFLCGNAGIEKVVIENQAGYIQGWLQVFKSDTNILIKTAAKAQKASDLILNKKFN